MIKVEKFDQQGKVSPVKKVAMAVEVNPTKTSALGGSASHVSILHHETYVMMKMRVTRLGVGGTDRNMCRNYKNMKI